MIDLKNWLKGSWLWLALGAAAVFTVVYSAQHLSRGDDASLWWLAAMAVAPAAIFIAIFVAEVDKKYWFTFAYAFTLLSLAVAVVPVVVGGEGFDSGTISVNVGCVASDAPVDLSCGGADKTDNAQWLIVVGARGESVAEAPSEDSTIRRFSGGLAVPLYLVFLSLLGGAVSLTRRVPEYQKRASDGYQPTADEPALDDPTVREYLIFQIVQFISAPFIAVVAYWVIAPTTAKMIVALAFLAGFSSETVLLWIRQASTKLRPTRSTQRGTVLSGVATQS